MLQCRPLISLSHSTPCKAKRMLQAASYRARVIDVHMTLAFICWGDLHLLKCSCGNVLLKGGEKRIHLANPHSCPDSHRWHPSGKSSETMQVRQKRIYDARQGGKDRIFRWLVPFSLLPGKQSRTSFFFINPIHTTAFCTL